MKLGIIVRADDTGLGYQTKNLTYMLKPDRILVIDSSSFNKGAKQHKDWYDGFNGYISKGFPTNQQIQQFANGLTHILTCEIPYNYHLFTYAQRRGIKTYLQLNYEFFDALNGGVPHPTKYIAPSRWHEKELERYSVEFLPPPTFASNFKEARETNLKKQGYRRFLHVVGRQAVNDRNGTIDLIESLEHCKEDFELVIRSQGEISGVENISDRRVTIASTNVADQSDMYKGFDAMILPRRYGGLCLPMNEALISGLPVLMTDVSPNNIVLPKEWLFKTSSKTSFYTRTSIDCYSSDKKDLAKKIDAFAGMTDEQLSNEKVKAVDIGIDNFSSDSLKPKYERLLSE